MRAKRNQGAEDVLAERREAPYACIYGNRRKLIKSLKMVVEIWDKHLFSYFYIMNPFLKLHNLTRPDHDTFWRLISRKLLRIGTCNFDTISIQVLKLSYKICNLHFFENLVSICYSASWKFRQFSAVFFYYNFIDWKGNLKFWWFQWK